MELLFYIGGLGHRPLYVVDTRELARATQKLGELGCPRVGDQGNLLLDGLALPWDARAGQADAPSSDFASLSLRPGDVVVCW